MNINELPPELLAMIFSKIDEFYYKVQLQRICKHWRQTVLDWDRTKICPLPLIDHQTLGLVLYRWGEWLEELWLEYMKQIAENQNINEYMVNQMANQMKQLKHLKLSKCRLEGPAVNSIADLFGQQLYSFILDKTDYHPNMRGLLENESSKLEHLNLHLYYSTKTGTLPTKLPNNLKSFSLLDQLNRDLSIPVLDAAKDCKNLKLLHFAIDYFGILTPNAILAIGNIQSLVYLNLDIDKIQNETSLQNVICGLPNLKALRIARHCYCSEETLSNICRGRPDLVHLNVSTRNAFQIPDSLNSLTLRIPIQFPSSAVDASQFLPELLFEQPNKSIQHLDIRSLVLPSSSNLIEKLLGQFPNLKSLHCKMPASNAELTSFFSLIEKHLAIGRKITIYVHFYEHEHRYHKYILPDDLPQFDTAVDWRPKMCEGKCENLVLKKLIKEAIDGGNNPSFLDDWWME